MDFPAIKAPIYPIKETIPDTAIKGKTENQTIIARQRFTRTPMSFALSWTALPEADYERLLPARRGRQLLRACVCRAL